MAGRAAGAAFYPVALVEAILRGIRDTADAEERLRSGNAAACFGLFTLMNHSALDGPKAG